MASFTALERAVVEMLLAGDLPALYALRAQFTASRVAKREFTGVGFFTDFDVPASAPQVSANRSLEIGDVEASISGLQHGAGFVLFVRGGVLHTLEGYTYDEQWPAEISSFSLQYWKTPRDLSHLGS
jgi:hypothetical protein